MLVIHIVRANSAGCSRSESYEAHIFISVTANVHDDDKDDTSIAEIAADGNLMKLQALLISSSRQMNQCWTLLLDY